jgi:hypothetical protein
MPFKKNAQCKLLLSNKLVCVFSIYLQLPARGMALTITVVL